jgi:hypothetical protein
MEEDNNNILKIVYWKVREGRYMRSLEVKDKKIFFTHPLNLSFFEGSKEDIRADFEKCRALVHNKEIKGVRL